MNRLVALAAFLWSVLVSLSACAPSPAPDTRALAAQPSAQVQSGDHMVIGGQTIVLADAETPQAGDFAGCRAEAVAADQTATRVRALLANAHQIDVHRVAKGQQALVHLDGLDLGLTLISDRLAVPRGPLPMNWCASTRLWGQTAAQRSPIDPA
jgi:hypothetical protein